MYEIKEDHKNRLPFVRVKRICIDKFKSVKHGEIVFNCGKEYVPYNTKSDILGLYGGNGSGKSSLVEAFYIIKSLLSGFTIATQHARFIDIDENEMKLCIEFDFQYRAPKEAVATVVYEVFLERDERKYRDRDENSDRNEQYIRVTGEIIRTNLYADGSIGRMHTIVDTYNNIFSGDTNDEFYFSKEDIKEIQKIKSYLSIESASFVFSNEVSKIVNEYNKKNTSKYAEILGEIQIFSMAFLYISGNQMNGILQMRGGIPVFAPWKPRPIFIDFRRGTFANEGDSFAIGKSVEAMNTVLAHIVPGLKIRIEGTDAFSEKGEPGKNVKLIAERENKKFPLHFESDGILKIISILGYYIYAFNQGSVTLVIDELDAGIYEYLLGELLKLFQEYGKGQLIFTAHSLRPLEVLNKKYIRFTTPDENNRYYKFKNLATKNNLRDVYIDEIENPLRKQDVKLYQDLEDIESIAEILKEAGKTLGIQDED